MEDNLDMVEVSTSQDKVYRLLPSLWLRTTKTRLRLTLPKMRFAACFKFAVDDMFEVYNYQDKVYSLLSILGLRTALLMH